MPRTKQRKVGDRIFYTDYKGNICTCLIKDIRDEISEFNKHGERLPEGKLFKYYIYDIDRYRSIEDYNCLPDNDPRVKEFCKNKRFITIDFENDLRQWLLEHSARQGDNDVAQILYDLAEEFE